MTNPQGLPLAGEYNESSPPLDPSQYSTLDALNEVVNDLVFNENGSHVTLSNSTTAESWYEFERLFNSAAKRLGEVNESFAKEIKALKDALSGDAGDALNKYATDLLNESEDLYNTLNGKKYGTIVGNVGHAIQAFAAGWWDIINSSDKSRKSQDAQLRAQAVMQLEQAQTLSDIVTVENELKQSLNTMNSNADSQLVKDLQGALGALGSQYNGRGSDLVPLHIVNGESKSHDPRYNAPQRPAFMTARPRMVNANPQSPQQHPQGPATGFNPGQVNPANQQASVPPGAPGEVTPGQGTPGEGTPGQGLGSPPAAQTQNPQTTNPGSPADAQQMQNAKNAANNAVAGLGSPPGALTGDPGGTPAGSPAGSPAGTPGGSPAGTPEANTPGATDPGQQQALQNAKNAANKAIDGLSAQTADPTRQKALDDAKQAADKAIDGLTDPSGTPGTPGSPGAAAGGPGDAAGAVGAPVPGGMMPGGGRTPDDKKALQDAKNAANKAIDGLSGQTSDPTRQKALDDAKQAADKAIGDLTNPSEAPKTSSEGPGQGKVDAAKDAAGKAIDDLSKPGDSPARQQALDDAKKAAQKAIGDLTDPSQAGNAHGTPGGPGDANGPGSPGSPGSPGDDPTVQHAKDAAGKAIDGLEHNTDDPVRKQALEDAKKAVEDAIGKTADPAHQGVGDAMHALDNMPRASDGPPVTSGGPSHDPALEHAKEAADKAIDALGHPGDSPDTQHALADAKHAVDKAIDGLAGDSHQFLAPDEHPKAADLAGLAGGAGGGAGGAGAGSLGGLTDGVGVGAKAPAPQGQFDLENSPPGVTAAQSGPAAGPGGQLPGNFAANASGMPMGGMPMGGMGGMGGAGAQQNKEREPQIWLQAEKGAWGKDGDDTAQNPVLGRS
ncbi:hypothetical protein [Amycolatopsis pigmentata]|uniref:Uncharacterized protein n=1 Tax=Amycolatopsis pigmentata TaxID=450801 RepID=A0ABW5FYC4_9PSEU